ncbi:zincin-like metallopeptidase domain-containing protein [Abyssalbus ytuae]|uniref:Zincin-like metallopeptidase domain-containing protein n=1 Tax=Abyssalbus ytuae TaxID=2926907 RepID=A0A9E7A2H6_9FLAO|nr:zincin-like metallopeptidase domain-containing protein [Abyssalbus ytuae]UOB18576.1 zincin-like metallopeptidase domain-containing protein [Abyssalbus ytuae]
MRSNKLFNELHGKTIDREEIIKIATIAFDEQNFEVHKRLHKLLDNHPDADIFNLTIDNPVTVKGATKKTTKKQVRKKSVAKKTLTPGLSVADPSFLAGVEYMNETEDTPGMGKTVKPEDIYQLITDRIVSKLKEEVKWEKEWGGDKEGYVIAYNFDSKKPYRGVNAFMLGSMYMYNPDFPLLRNPYYLTFKQIQKHKGKLKKNTAGFPVMYYTFLFKIQQDKPKLDFATYDKNKAIDFVKKNFNKINFLREEFKKGKTPKENLIGIFLNKSRIPILKYYYVFNGEDITGIDFDLDNFKGRGKISKINNTSNEKLQVPESIIKNYPSPKPKLKFGGERAFYSPAKDLVQMPNIEQFKYVQAYYTTFFHELIHCSGSKKRLDRLKPGAKFGSKDYAFEELIAELGASFLSAEAGILHYTFRNSVAYIKGWRKELLNQVKKDNKFIFKAASQAQKATDYILQAGPDGKPKYLKHIKEEKKEFSFSFKKPLTEKTLFEATIRGYGPEKLDNKELAKSMAYNRFANYILRNLKTLDYNGSNLLQEAGKDELYKTIKKEVDKRSIKVNIDIDLSTYKNKKMVAPSLGTAVIDTNQGSISSENGTGVIEGVAPVPVFMNENLDIDPVEEPEPVQLNEAANVENKPEVKSVKPKVNNSYVKGLKNVKKTAENIQYFSLKGDFAEFLGRIEKKPEHSVVITLDAPPGAGKTRSVFQMLDMFADSGLNSVFASLEEHPVSKLFTKKADMYINPSNEDYIHTIGDLPPTYKEFLHIIETYDVIAIDSWNKVFETYKGLDFDNSLRKALDGKIIVTIFQRTQDGKMRGGANAAFDGDIILEVVADPDYRKSYLRARKNRYQEKPLHEVGYSIFNQKLINPEKETEAMEGDLIIT